MSQEQLSAEEAAMVATWEQHLGAEFGMKSASAALETMSAHPYVVLVPVATGGTGRDGVGTFYGDHFLPAIPDDMMMTPVARTLGKNRLVDELVLKFTHSIRMDWFLPGVEATHKKIEMAFVAVVEFEDGKVSGERLYWDQASVLAQLGLIDRSLPVVGPEGARRLLDPSVPMNELMHRAKA
ncbi:MAG: ester cyclase [Polyangiaceae bacterium]